MAELIVEPIQTAELESSGYIGQPEGNIDLTENNVQVNVAPYKYATPKIPIQEDVPAVNPSTQEQTIVPDIGYEGMKSVKVNPANLETKRVTPTMEEQTIVPQSPAIGFSQFTVEPVTPFIDPDIQPENIKQGVDILGVQGTLKPPTLITKQITENGTYTAAEDNADGYSEVTVDVVASSKCIIDMSTNLHNKATDKPNTYLSAGKEISYDGWSSTDYIQIPERFVWSLSIWNPQGGYRFSCLYTEDKTYISELTNQFIVGIKPSDAFYVRFSEKTSNINMMSMFPLEERAECIVPASINMPLNFSNYNISVKSLIDILNALEDRTGDTTYRLTIGATNLNKLTAEQKAIATNKNWTLA